MPFTTKDKELHAAVRGKRTLDEIGHIIDAGANVNSLTEEGTVLHYAVADNNSPLIKLLLEKGADINLTDKQFRTPIDIAENNKAVLNHLIECHQSMTLSSTNKTIMHLSRLIEFCIEHYHGLQKNAEEDRLLLDYAISKLTCVNIDKHRRSISSAIDVHATHWDKYIGHLRSLAAIDRNSGKVEGFFQHDFLPLRIRSLFEVIIKIEKRIILPEKLPKVVDNDLKQNRLFILSVLKQELLAEVETLHIRRLCQKPLASHNSIAKNIITKLNRLPVNIEYSIAGGWKAHSVYVSLPKTTQQIGAIEPRIDNLGGGSNKKCLNSTTNKIEALHQPEDPKNPNKVKSCILKAFNNDLVKYLANVIYTIKKQVEEEEGIRLIYNLHNNQLTSGTGNNTPFFPIQTVGNCTVEAHRIGLQIRLGNLNLYNWLLNEELELASRELSAFKSVLDDREICEYWRLEDQSPELPLSLSLILRNSYNRKIQEFTDKNKLSLEKLSFNFTSIPDPSSTVNVQSSETSQPTGNGIYHHELVSLENFFSREVNENILVVALPGGGKTTLSDALPILWSHGKMWQHFKWVLRISFRNLNDKKKYPDGTQYNLLDILRKEYSGDEYDGEFLPVNLKNQDSMLIIADGYNELEYSKSMEIAISELLSIKNVIITSTHSNIPGFKPTSCLELSDFSEKQIKEYIDDFFAESLGKAKELSTYLSQNITARALAKKPINLKIICSIWPAQIETATDIYLKLFYQHLKIYKEKTGSVVHNIKYECKNEINALELIAFFSFQQDNRFIIDIEVIEAVFAQLNITNFSKQSGVFNGLSPIDSLLMIGFLTKINSQQYNFFHPLFQSFLVAHYLAKCIKKNLPVITYNKSLNCIVEKSFALFIASIKYHPHYEPVLMFVAGLLAGSQKQQLLEIFFDTLLQMPRDLLGIREICLMLQCMNEAKLPKLTVNEQIIHLVKSNLMKDAASYKDSHLARYLQQSPIVAQSPLFIEFYLELFQSALANNTATKNRFLVKLMNNLRIAHPKIIQQLCAMLDSQIKIDGLSIYKEELLDVLITLIEIDNSFVNLLHTTVRNQFLRLDKTYPMTDKERRSFITPSYMMLYCYYGKALKSDILRPLVIDRIFEECQKDLQHTDYFIMEQAIKRIATIAQYDPMAISILKQVTQTSFWVNRQTNMMFSSDTNSFYRNRIAITALISLNAASNEDIRKAIQALEPHHRIEVRQAACEALKGMRVVRKDVVDALLRAISNDMEFLERAFALTSLVNLAIMDPSLITSFINVLQTGSYFAKDNMIDIFGRLRSKDPIVINEFLKLSAEKTPLRRRIAYAFKSIGICDNKIVSVLIAFLNDDLALTRGDAADALYALLTPKDFEVKDQLLPYLQHEDRKLRLNIAKILLKLGILEADVINIVLLNLDSFAELELVPSYILERYLLENYNILPQNTLNRLSRYVSTSILVQYYLEQEKSIWIELLIVKLTTTLGSIHIDGTALIIIDNNSDNRFQLNKKMPSFFIDLQKVLTKLNLIIPHDLNKMLVQLIQQESREKVKEIAPTIAPDTLGRIVNLAKDFISHGYPFLITQESCIVRIYLNSDNDDILQEMYTILAITINMEGVEHTIANHTLALLLPTEQDAKKLIETLSSAGFILDGNDRNLVQPSKYLKI